MLTEALRTSTRALADYRACTIPPDHALLSPSLIDIVRAAFNRREEQR